MKRKLFLFVALLPLGFQLNAQQLNAPHLSPSGLFDTDLRGPVKMVKTVYRDSMMDMTSTVTNYYNKAGLLERTVHKSFDGFSMEERYQYNKSGKLVCYRNDFLQISYFEYDKRGCLTRIVDVDSTDESNIAYDTTLIECDANGRMKYVKTAVKSAYYPTIIRTDTIVYDANGRIASILKGSGSNHYTYNSNGHMLTEKNAKNGCTYNVYNDKGFIVSTRFESTSKTNPVYNRHEYSYSGKYDKHGNWLRRLDVEIDNGSTIIETRTITYYP